MNIDKEKEEEKEGVHMDLSMGYEGEESALQVWVV